MKIHMEKNNLSQHILEKIKRDHISPAPRYAFLLKRLFFWAVALLFLACGIFSFAAVFFVLFNNDWDLSSRFATGPAVFTIKVFPYFWIVFCLLFVILAWYNYRHTKFGYRARIVYIVIFYLFITSAGGALMYKQGVGYGVENIFARYFPAYNHLNYSRSMWLNPQQGFLSGTIIATAGTALELKDAEGDTWSVDISSTTIKDGMTVVIGNQIKVIGYINNSQFVAQEIRPWCGCGGCTQGMQNCSMNGCGAKVKESCCGGRISK